MPSPFSTSTWKRCPHETRPCRVAGRFAPARCCSERQRPAVGATRAAAPFADAWAQVPSSAAARKAANVVVFGGHGNFAGFNTFLTCCNQLWAGFAGANETLRGAYIQNARGDWVRDLVSKAAATNSGVSYTIKPNAYWYWGGKKVPVTYRDFVYTLQKIDDPNSDVAGRAGYNQLDPTRFTHRGDKQVTFFWRTKNCSTDSPCGPYAKWQFPRAALSVLRAGRSRLQQDLDGLHLR